MIVITLQCTAKNHLSRRSIMGRLIFSKTNLSVCCCFLKWILPCVLVVVLTFVAHPWNRGWERWRERESAKHWKWRDGWRIDAKNRQGRYKTKYLRSHDVNVLRVYQGKIILSRSWIQWKQVSEKVGNKEERKLANWTSAGGELSQLEVKWRVGVPHGIQIEFFNL